MSAPEDLASAKYVSFTTFRRSGDAVPTATWLVPLDDGRVGFWTSSRSGKAKRLAHTSRVTLQPSDQRGRVVAGTGVVDGTAETVTGGPAFDEVVAKVKAKYGFMTTVSKVLNRIGHLGKGDFPYGDVVVLVTLPDS